MTELLLVVAVKKYGALPKGMVVRHLNGVKADNASENLVVGTTAENQMDHNTARAMAMYWREKYECLLRFHGDQVRSGEAVELIRQALDHAPADGRAGG